MVNKDDDFNFKTLHAPYFPSAGTHIGGKLDVVFIADVLERSECDRQ